MSTEFASLASLPQNDAVVLVVDLVESVRLMQVDESLSVGRWRAFVRAARDGIIPAHGGRLVKSLGDGLMVEFDHPVRAVRAASALHESLQEGNRDLPAKLHMYLRAALHSTRVYADELDIYGSGVNLAARLVSLAGPGETVVSAAVRDCLTEGLDAEIEDLGERELQSPKIEYLGECYLKHIDQPVRAYRVGAAGARPAMPARTDYSVTLQPTIAVIPFALRGQAPEYQAIGELIADGVIARLSRACHLRVISRLSTTVFRDRDASVSEVEAYLRAAYVLSGSYVPAGERLLVSWELADARDHLVVTAGRMQIRPGDLLDPEGELVLAIASEVHDSILRVEVARTMSRPLPTLESYALLLGGIQLLHRSSKKDFERSFELLNHLAEKHPKSVEPRIWQAKWYALRAVQGLTENRSRETRAALACTAAALDQEPDNSFALAMEGFVHCHLSQDYDAAHARLTESVQLNPSESFGHLFKGVIHGLLGDFEAGLQSFDAATTTSPLDPAKYLFDSIGSYLHFGARNHEQAITLARRSLRQNRHHAHSWRILTAAEVEAGHVEIARESLRSLLRLQPGLTVDSYLAAGRPDDRTRLRISEALRGVGLPVH